MFQPLVFLDFLNFVQIAHFHIQVLKGVAYVLSSPSYLSKSFFPTVCLQENVPST